MNREQAELWARAFSRIPPKPKNMCRTRHGKRPAKPKPRPEPEPRLQATFTPQEKQEILWHALYGQVAPRFLRGSRRLREWWVLLLMVSEPRFDVLASKMGETKEECTRLYRLYKAARPPSVVDRA